MDNGYRKTKKANMWHGREKCCGLWPPAFPRSLERGIFQTKNKKFKNAKINGNAKILKIFTWDIIALFVLQFINITMLYLFMFSQIYLTSRHILTFITFKDQTFMTRLLVLPKIKHITCCIITLITRVRNSIMFGPFVLNQCYFRCCGVITDITKIILFFVFMICVLF